MKRIATATWNGGLKDGRGTFSVASGTITKQNVTFRTRFESDPGTNPEELIAAAHASCFSMALSAQLGERGITPASIETTCTITFENLALTKSLLQTTVHAEGADKAKVEEAAAAAKAGRRSLARTVFDWLGRPALQPVYAAGAAVLMVLTFVAFHPEARGIRKRIDVGFHRTVGAVEKLYADAGGLKGEIRALSADVLKSFNTLGLAGDGEKKQ